MLWPKYAGSPHTWAEGHFGHFIFKNRFLLIKSLYFPFYHSSSQFDIWLGFKLALGLRVWASWGNRGSSRKGYKMQCLQMPFFWFMSFANGIKVIRDKTFCFDVRLRLNPRTRHTSCIHGEECNSRELCGICMSKFHICCSENEQWQVYYPRTYFPTRKQMASDLLS